MGADNGVLFYDYQNNIYLTKTRSLAGGKGLGVFYWEPQCYGGWKGYTLGAFDESGKPTMALDAFGL